MGQVKSQELGMHQSNTGILKRIKEGITNLFKPEEVEVTFKTKGNQVTYTYTKIEVRHVA